MDNQNETKILSFTASNVLSIVAIVLSVISILFSSLTMYRGSHKDFRPNNQPMAAYEREINPNDKSYYKPNSQGYKPQFDRPFYESKGPGKDFNNSRNSKQKKETQ